MIYNDSGSSEYVDAIEEGKIVRVTKEYANKEGLFVLRKAVQEEAPKPAVGFARPKERERGRTPLDLDKYRKPLSFKNNSVREDLLDNFHWEVAKARKLKGLTRKRLSEIVGVDEEHIKMVENGLLPRDDFVLIAKLENALGINLRKSAVASLAKKEEEVTEQQEVVEDKPKSDIVDIDM